ncbi:hypothetical protein HYPSUDRAFT_209360 [Hypholoma sublateritium FD-334 SS-4]|uniref:Uncharacterized protein n=1 Tax=Hypholoma sublateritium (strain FD-334 SS-4) TaxID=945553 RepID=A0A0D2N354_HYPSF|nr:hypothetical protein HYPSUDRAFT_209360 [Hypholoma sublateritium FD-334 SS-4]
MTISVGCLKAVKNAAIGNPKTKADLAQDPFLLAAYVPPFPVSRPFPPRPPNHPASSTPSTTPPSLPRPHMLWPPSPSAPMLPSIPCSSQIPPAPSSSPLLPTASPTHAPPSCALSASSQPAPPTLSGPYSGALHGCPPRAARAAAAATCNGLCASKALDVYLPPIVGNAVPRHVCHCTAPWNAGAYPGSARCHCKLDTVPCEPTCSRCGWEKTAAVATPVVIATPVAAALMYQLWAVAT